jgi:hypothetical protein
MIDSYLKNGTFTGSFSPNGGASYAKKQQAKKNPFFFCIERARPIF